MNQPHPRLPEFKYYQPKSSKEAVDFLDKHADQSRPYAGGTDCFNQVRDRRILPQYLVDLKSIGGFRDIKFDPKKGLTVGAAVPLNEIIFHPKVKQHYPVLIDAAREVGGYQLRNRATLVGNLCNASPCGDTIGPCLVYLSKVHIVGPGGKRKVDLKDFFEGPGKTSLKPGEIVESISFPIPPAGAKGAYQSIGRNKFGDLAIAAVTVLGYEKKDNPSGYEFLLTLTAVAPTVIFANLAQDILRMQPITHSILEQAAAACSEACKPIDDIRSSARYRRDMIRMLALRGLEETCKLLNLPL
ncbi:MAG: xanthine dehydrogenase family protein subunit M [Pelolinea sp.]|nr:xanthine dehydrogenase family protein subunit M [Pelolinea sp.]